MNCLFASSEVYPLIKTGGLADVSGSLPRALLKLGEDVRVIMPAYQSVMQKAGRAKEIATTQHYGHDIRVLETNLPGTRVKVMLVDCPAMFDRPGNPYLDASGESWSDNALRFALFSQVVVDVALNRLAFDWPVDVVHCNDWQTGLVPALLDQFAQRPATLFSIHNLAYQGLFDKQVFFDLGLPLSLWHMGGLEFHDLLSFIKGGLAFADCITTVSPQYAREIQTPEFGYGLSGLLAYRAERLFGILNGIDTDVWNPGSDEYLVQKYNRRSPGKKVMNKLAMQEAFALPERETIPMIGMISRLVEQKGLDIILQAMPQLLALPLQMVFLGSGQSYYEHALIDLAQQYPDRLAVKIGYDEEMSHRIEAASDMYLMPSMFEPCGLNQLYSLRYGTIPLVTPVGGLVDSVIDYAETNSTGFIIPGYSAQALVETIERALVVYADPVAWSKLQQRAMAQDYSWQKSAGDYAELYRTAVQLNAAAAA